ncbi:hypothetical protein BC943DRAFT_322945 [Umbelopsis sp. AD052]|nr:hypothetical protein BC943DRAFT_322945 [Umbelopsis sp. AD052]
MLRQLAFFRWHFFWAGGCVNHCIYALTFQTLQVFSMHTVLDGTVSTLLSFVGKSRHSMTLAPTQEWGCSK